MTVPAPQPTLQEGVLAGADVVAAGASDALGRRLTGLGARVHAVAADPGDEAAVTSEIGGLTGAGVLVCDIGPALRAGGADGSALADAVAGAFALTRVTLTVRLRPAGRGLVVLIAPRPRDGAQAGAAAAALENLARTTSVEWARFGVRVVAVCPRDATTDEALADLVAYLVSPAGAYFSGCRLDLGTVGLTGYASASS